MEKSKTNQPRWSESLSDSCQFLKNKVRYKYGQRKESDNMTKEVFVKIRGLQFLEETEHETLEVISVGNYYKKNGKHYILYDEVQEGFSGVTKNVIKVSENCLELTKKGVVNVHMLFEKNKKTFSDYHTPFGNLKMSIYATNIFVDEKEETLTIKVTYKLKVNQEYLYLAESSVFLTIQSKETKDFKICS